MALIDTISGADSNSYCSLAYADDYFAATPNALKRDGWAALSEEAKIQVLVQACTMLDALRLTDGLDRIPYSSTQALQLPRADHERSGAAYMPENAKDAQCEQAYYLATADTSAIDDQRQGIKNQSMNADGAGISTSYTGIGDEYAPRAITLIRPLFVKTNSVKMKRG